MRNLLSAAREKTRSPRNAKKQKDCPFHGQLLLGLIVNSPMPKQIGNLERLAIVTFQVSQPQPEKSQKYTHRCKEDHDDNFSQFERLKTVVSTDGSACMWRNTTQAADRLRSVIF